LAYPKTSSSKHILDDPSAIEDGRCISLNGSPNCEAVSRVSSQSLCLLKDFLNEVEGQHLQQPVDLHN